MRIEKVRKKVKRRVNIPEDLKGFLKEVYECILAKDEATLIESDDLLQEDFVYGGLIGKDGTEYGFTYFPGEGTRNKWELIFTVGQLRDIYEDRVEYLDLWACQSEDCGCKFSDEWMKCFYCDYVDEGEIVNE